MWETTEEYRQNEAVARQINHETRANPDSPYAGKHVGIVRGQVVAVADTLDELIRLLERIEPEAERRFSVEASADYDTPDYIWRAR
jgi:hypothetical protein